MNLYLASKSKSRQQLLNEARIPFSMLEQDSAEIYSSHHNSLKDILTEIALGKMDHTVLPQGVEGQEILVLTADTMGMTKQGRVCGKPLSKEDAIAMIREYRDGAITGTAFCLDRKKFHNNQWELVKRITGYMQAEYVFDIPDQLISWYLDSLPLSYLDLSGAVTIEGIGSQFLKTINGSYTAVLGLPMHEIREALIDIVL